MCEYKWTNKPPTEPGHYWYKLGSAKEGIEFMAIRYVWNREGELVVSNGECTIPVKEMERLWAGPVAEPVIEVMSNETN